MMKSLKFDCSYLFSEDDRILQMSAFSYVQYSDRLPLSYSTLMVEQRAEVKNEVKTDWSKVRLSTLETGFGMELGVRINKHIMMRNFVALSVFYHTDYVIGMFSDKCAPVLMLGTSFNLSIPNKKLNN